MPEKNEPLPVYQQGKRGMSLYLIRQIQKWLELDGESKHWLNWKLISRNGKKAVILEKVEE